MKSLQLILKPLSLAIIGIFSVSSNAALYKIIDIDADGIKKNDISDAGEINNFSVAGSSDNTYTGYWVGTGNFNGVLSLDKNDPVIEGEIPDETGQRRTLQKDVIAIYQWNDAWQRLRLWDEKIELTGQYTETTNDYFTDVTDNGVTVGYGSAPYRLKYWIDSNTDYKYSVVRDFSARAFAYDLNSNAGPKALLGAMDQDNTDLANDDYGNYSIAYSIEKQANGGFIAIGESATAVTEKSKLAVEACFEQTPILEERTDLRIVCQSLAEYYTKATVWKLNDSLKTNEIMVLGSLIDNDDSYTGAHYSRLNGINQNGYIVGTSTGYNDLEIPNASSVGSYATIYRDLTDEYEKEEIDITPRYINDENGYTGSSAIDINNNDIVVGEAIKPVAGIARTKAFYYDINEKTKNPKLTEIPSRFESSASTVNKINDNGVMVGEFEWDPKAGTATRGRHGYVYQIYSKDFIDLDEAVCSKDWEIVEANDIRDDGVIFATAVKKELVTVNGDVVLDQNEELLYTEVFRAVALQPIEGGKLETCQYRDNPFPEHERQGLGVGALVALFCAVAAFIRRRFKR